VHPLQLVSPLSICFESSFMKLAEIVERLQFVVHLGHCIHSYMWISRFIIWKTFCPIELQCTLEFLLYSATFQSFLFLPFVVLFGFVYSLSLVLG